MSFKNYLLRPRVVVIMLLLLGLGLLSYSLVLPKYTSQQAADSLLSNWGTLGKVAYFKQEAVLRTNKIACLDAGSGLIVLSIILLSFLLATRCKTPTDFFKLRTLTKPALLIGANLSVLLMVPGMWWYYVSRLQRGDYPPFADSIGIPIAAQVPVYLWMLAPVNAFLLVLVFRIRLPTLLFSKACSYTVSVIGWEVFFGTCLLINILLLISFVIDGDHFSIVVNSFFTYALLSLRAGRMN